MFHIALTPNNYPANALSAKGKTLIAALGELFKTLEVLELNEDCVSHVLEATKEAVDNLLDDEPAKGTWYEMGSDDDAFSIDIFLADDARYVRVGDDDLLAPHGAVGWGVNPHNDEQWIYSEDDAAGYDWVHRPQPVRSDDGLDAAVRSVVEPPRITEVTRIVKYGNCTLYATFDHGSGDKAERKLFSFYVDELSFTDADLIGKTEDEAHELRRLRDIAYLRS
jgi:hypothetical protein